MEVEAEKRGRKQGDEAAYPPPLRRSRDQTQERHKSIASGAETEAEEEAENKEYEDRYGETPRR